MPLENRMRDYSQFPATFPQSKAGYVRVTHPCAALIVLLRLPLDLHVLGLPLAFILSQDQTLHRSLFLYFQMSLRELYLLSAFQQFQFNFVLFLLPYNRKATAKVRSFFELPNFFSSFLNFLFSLGRYFKSTSFAVHRT